MAIVTGDRYLEKLVKFVEEQAGLLIEGSLVLKLNAAGLHYVQSRLEALHELERLLAGAPVDYLRAYVSDLGDHRALEQLRRILRLLTSLKVVSALPPPARDPTPLSLLPFGRLKVLELRGCDLSTSAAKGLLELRHTLEKIICHNSTDALRHVFVSRIAEIKDSPQWNRLSFVSCACNRLVLMDESLQLLPAVETLDLSRNKFAKVDNLRKCTRLKHLDLGFNNLRTVAAFNEVSCRIVKLVLRNNALTTLRGIENLKSLEGLDISYNIISSFSEIEFLAGLPSLRSLWLEGNPLCGSSWYRAQIFSYLPHPDKLKLDDNEISTKELWQMQIIIARRQKRPASFGFYSPAINDADADGSGNQKKKKVSRLASIESEEESTCIGSDRESLSCDNEIQNKEETFVSDDDAEIVDLMTRVENMKKARSVLWLREVKEWMDHASDNHLNGSNYGGATLHPGKGTYTKDKKSQQHVAESLRYVSDSLQASGDDSSTIILTSENSFADMSSGLHTPQYFDHVGSLGITGGVCLPGMGRMDLIQEHQNAYSHESASGFSLQAKSLRADTLAIRSHLTTIDDTMDSHSSSACPGSPPHYQEDILHRRHNLVEEILQLSAESYSVASSDSDTSSSDDDLCKFGLSMPVVGQSLDQECVEGLSSSNLFEDNVYDQTGENGTSNDFSAGANDGENANFVNQETDCLEKKKRKKHRRIIISVLGEKNMVGTTETSEKSNGNLGIGDVEIERGKHMFGWNDCERVDKKNSWENAVTIPSIDNDGKFAMEKSSSMRDNYVEHYFNENVADSGSHETCRQYMFCCVLEQEAMNGEREVALLRSSENKLYVLLLGVTFDGSGTNLSLLGCHKIEEVQEVLVGLGLQVVRLATEAGATYLFITRNIESSRKLLCTLQVFESFSTDICTLRSLEQVQVELFEKQVCGGSKLSIFQYSMVLFWRSDNEGDSWLSRSLFLIRGHVLVCVEDLTQFSSLSVDSASPPYYSLDSCFSINDVSELVIEARESLCLTLTVEYATSKFCPTAEVVAVNKGKACTGSLTWKFRWFSEYGLLNFVALLKAMHTGKTDSPLPVRCVS